ncbi:hypothetical protein M3Y98_00501400 [Aphelenchoides besseyi]|nr:hypothetical protein M3Y98_00501400 [Aphelenchoides besseyi]KAI6207765.1 hypothetical protein M3Y96_00043600 [Aphelenchoides besseyi]
MERPPATDEHLNKRVSFGGEEEVKLIVYDNPYSQSTYTLHARRSTTPPDGTLNRVLVTSEQSEIPRPISPPAQIENLPPDQAVSPPLPSLIKRMENETDNPFRPQETLYHEVDPIVEAYRTRPFPPSPTSSPVPPDLTPIKNGRHVTLENSTTYVTEPDGTPVRSGPTTTTFDASPKHNLLSQQGNGANELPPPNNVELVHVDNKKKKCHCCSIQ